MNWKETLLIPAKGLISLFRVIIDFIYPPFCIVCQTSLSKDERLICDNCWNNFPQIDGTVNIAREIRSKLSDPIYFSNAISVWEFSSPIQQAIHYLKYQNFRFLAGRIGRIMAKKLKDLSLPLAETVLIPVPLHKTRLRERGYNQSSLICETIVVETGVQNCDNNLQRIRYTKSQTKLSAIERTKNVKDAFSILHAEEIKNKVIILVDDVITTGATMNACAKELIENGAKSVYLFSAAKA